MISNFPRYTVKAGRFVYDLATKKVKVSKDKGNLNLFTNQEYENHLSWVNLDTNVEEIDIIVFPFDATFQKVTGQNNTFVLRFQSNEDRYFFYLQEKIQADEFVKKVNERIAFTPPEDMEVEEPQKQEPQKMEAESPQKTKPILNQQFITRLTNNLIAAQKKEQGGITHLSKILTSEAISTFLSQLEETDKHAMLQFLPEEQKGIQHINSNVRSPQFQQAADVLSDALNSQNVIPLFMEMGLDQKYLKQYYGVHAFLLALQEKAKKEKQQE